MIQISSPPQVPISHIEQDFRTESSTSFNLDSVQGDTGFFAKLLESFRALNNEGNPEPNPGIGDSRETQRIGGIDDNSAETAAGNAHNIEIVQGQEALQDNLSGEEAVKNLKDLSVNKAEERDGRGIQALIAEKNESIPLISMLQENPLNEISDNVDQNFLLANENLWNLQELANRDNTNGSLEELINVQGTELSNNELIELIDLTEDKENREVREKLISKENSNFESLLRENQEISGKEIPVSMQNLHEEESSPLREIQEKSRPHIEIRDLRTERNSTMENRVESESLKTDTGIKIEIPVELSSAKAMDEPKSFQGSREAVQSRFEDALARELRNGLSSDIVKNAQIIVRDGGEGTIRLSLRPASLGDVKIRLEMVENKIMGLIILESNEALRAFERELAVLEKNFRDSGFSDASFTLSLENEAWNFNGQEQESEENNSSAEINTAFAAFRYEADRDDIVVYSNSGGRTPINLLV